MARASMRIDSHVHVWAPPELAATKYPYQATLIGSATAAPPVDGAAPRLLAALKREAEAAAAASARGNRPSSSSPGRVGALVVQAGCHQYDHSYLTDALMAAPPGQLVGCALADPSRGAAAGVAALRALAALSRDDGRGGGGGGEGGGGGSSGPKRRQLYRAVRFNPYLWPAHAAEPAGVTSSGGSNGGAADAAAAAAAAAADDDRRMAGPTGRALFSAAGELGLAACFMPFRGLSGVADDIERLMDASPSTAVVIDHYGFCAASGGGTRSAGGGGGAGAAGAHAGEAGQRRSQPSALLVGRSPEWRRLLSWARARPQVRVKASAAVRVSRAPYPHADAALHALRALVDAFGAERVLWGSDWPWVEDAATFAAAAAAASGASSAGEASGAAPLGAASGASGAPRGGGGGWAPYGYEGSWRLPTDAAAAGADDGFVWGGVGEGGGADDAGAPVPRPAPLTDDEARWVFGESARALFPGAWWDEGGNDA